MNLDNIKEIWDKEKIESTPEISIEQQKEIHTPLEMIRMNMRNEFWLSIIFYPFIWGFVFFGDTDEQRLLLICLGIISSVIGAYYYIKFYNFYKKISTQSLNTYHNILDLRYELVLNSELYKSHYVSFIPIIFSVYMVLEFPKREDGGIIVLFILSVIVFITTYISGKYWLHERYGKYIKQISKIITEITSETDEFQYNRSIINLEQHFTFLGKTQSFFDKKFGKYSSIILGIFLFLILLIVSFSVGFLVSFWGLIK